MTDEELMEYRRKRLEDIGGSAAVGRYDAYQSTAGEQTIYDPSTSNDEEYLKAYNETAEELGISTYSNPTEWISVNFSDTKASADALDKMSKLDAIRRIEPLDYYAYIGYPHRTRYDDNHLRLGDVELIIPPEFIMVTSDSTSTQIITLRQENTQKEKHGHHKKNILIDLVFSSLEQINGFAVPAPRHRDSSGDLVDWYYVDGLRQLLAEFKCTPFIPVRNYLLNTIHNIHVVALQAITISTVNGFPNVLRAQLTLQSIEMEPFIGVPNQLFKCMIDWDLFRMYYQSMLTEKHKYKKLQSIPAKKKEYHFRISALNPDVFSDKDYVGEANILEVITDSKIIGDRESNYTILVDSDSDGAVIQEFECGYSNILTNVQLSQLSEPTVQFIGGMDTIYNITFRTDNEKIVQQLQLAQTINDQLIRQYPTLQGSLGFVKLESELVEFTGSLFVMVDSLTSATVPGFPGVYNVQIHCVSYDIAQSSRENLNGFRPFDDYLNTGTTVDQKDKSVYENETITNDIKSMGFIRKLKQDLYAEEKFTKMELYPDLCLPTYGDVDEFIGYLRQFRSYYNLTQIEYDSYPMNPVTSIHGQPAGSLPKGNSSGYMYPCDLGNITKYHGYVDPDFYVFYPITFKNTIGDDDFKLTSRSASTITKYEYKYPESVVSQDIITIGTGSSNVNVQISAYTGSDNIVIETFIAYLESMVGVSEFIMGAGHWSGSTRGSMDTSAHKYTQEEIKWDDAHGYHIHVKSGKPCFDCTGYVMYGLNHAIPGVGYSFTASGSDKNPILEDSKHFESIGTDFNLAKRGDILVLGSSTEPTHCAVYVGEQDGYNVVHCKGWGYGAFHDSYHIGEASYLNGNHYKKLHGIMRCKAFETYAAYVEDTVNGSTTENSGSELNIVKPLYKGTYESLCSVLASPYLVGAALQDTQDELMLACAQYLYDKFTTGYTIEDIRGKYGSASYTSDHESAITRVFINGERKFEQKISYCIDSSNFNEELTWDDIKKDNTVLTQIGQYTFFTPSEEEYSNTTKFYIVEDPSMAAVGDERYEISTVKKDIVPLTITEKDISNEFAEPLLVKLAAVGAKSDAKDLYVNKLNTQKNWFNTSFHDQYQYSYKGRLTRAFPTFLLAFLDDDGAWYDGRKLWTNYYPYRAVVDIQTHAAYDMPVETATIVVSNSQHNLSTVDYGLAKYNIYEDKEIFSQGKWGDIQKWFYQNLAIPPISTSVFGGAKLTADMMRMHQIIYSHAKLREGTRVHLRIGYGSDPTCLATVMNGIVTECSIGDQISLIVSSDGNELISNIVSSRKKASNNGLLGLFGLGADQESSNIISEMLCKRESWANAINHKWFEASEYNIEHYGWFLGQSVFANSGEGLSTSGNTVAGMLVGAGVYAVGSAIAGGPLSLVAGAILIIGGAVIGFVTGPSKDDENKLSAGREHIGLKDMWDQYAEQFDILANVYKGGYKAELYLHNNILGFDSEKNIVYRKYNMTPWDVVVTMTNNVPSYICKSSYFMFESRLFFGLPFYLEKTRYLFLGGLSKDIQECQENIWCEMKSASQVHMIDSLDGIIDNQMKVSGKHTYTNVNVIYLDGGTSESTGIIYSDASIDRSRQKTKVLDTSICQDALGPDWLYDKLGLYDLGWHSAQRAGISELIYGWQQQYQGQIICMGQPGIKPQDHIILADHYSGIHGLCMVREVTHSFSINTGFTTSIIPGMVACSTSIDSGQLEYMTTYLSMCEAFVYHSMGRLEMIEFYETYSSLLSAIEYMREEGVAELKAIQRLNTGAKITSSLATAIITVPNVIKVYKRIRTAGGLSALLDVGKTAWSTMSSLYESLSTAKGAAESSGLITNLLTKAGNGLKAFKGGTSAAASGLSKFVTKGSIALFVISVAIEHITRYLSNLDSIQVIPLWKDGIPFVTNVKGGNSIVLTKNMDQTSDDNAQDYEDVGGRKTS